MGRAPATRRTNVKAGIRIPQKRKNIQRTRIEKWRKRHDVTRVCCFWRGPTCADKTAYSIYRSSRHDIWRLVIRFRVKLVSPVGAFEFSITAPE
jgi:hypothetical protein